MKTSKYGEIIFGQDDLCDAVMRGYDVANLKNVTVDRDINLEQLATIMADPGLLLTWTFPEESDISVPEFDRIRQQNWLMPKQYHDMDIAEYVLSLCQTQEEIQRVGQELLMYQERDLFDLLKYLKYLVDTMKSNNLIWGVGRGSSVASYVLYKLGVHRIDSMFYDLDPAEFLR